MTDLQTAIEILCDDPAALRAVLGDVLDHPPMWKIKMEPAIGEPLLLAMEYESREQAEIIADRYTQVSSTFFHTVVPYTIRAAWEDRKRGIK